jgi:hypothetical protein
MPDENDVNITKHKRLLEGIRNGGEDNGRSGISDRHAESGHDSHRQDAGGAIEGHTGVRGGEERASQGNGTAPGLREGVRPPQPKDVNTVARPRHRKSKESERVEDKPAPTRLRLPFLEKSQTKKTPVRLFSLEEAEAEQERMAEIYSKLFDFGDDVLEIIVRDHEPVEIWHITEEQADTLARNHLNQARTNVEAARSARKLLEIYDRLYFYSVIIPRVVKTSNHIAEHKGVSFK